MSLGRAIIAWRIKRGMSQLELAQAAGLSVSYISLLERDKRDPALSTLRKLAAALGVPLFLLVTSSDELVALPLDISGRLALMMLEAQLP